MSFASIGDLAKSLQFRHDNALLRQKLVNASSEMSTGRRHDIPAALGGDLTILSSLERGDRLSAVYLRSSTIIASHAEALQASLEVFAGYTTGLGSELASTASLGMPSALRTQTVVARQGLETAIGSLNLRVGEGYLLSGQRTDLPPLPGADEMLSQVRAVVTGLTTASDVAAAVDDWFAAPTGGGGYADFYRGDEGPVLQFRISDTERTGIEMTALDPAFRTVLSGLVIASLSGDAALAGSVDPAAMLAQASDRLVGSSDAIEALRAGLGRTQQTIEEVSTRTRANTAAMALVRENLIGVDTADAATDVIAVQTQLEALYTLTARVQQMKLVNFL